jgi:hypothetical protein
MNSEELTRRPQEQIQPESVLIPVVVGAGLTGLAFWLLRKITRRKRIIIADPPPIFIKSGSFIIDSERGFKRDGNNSHPKRPKLNVYEANSGPVKSVIINQANQQIVNDSARPFGDFFSDPDGLTISIWLDRFDENNQTWQGVSGDPDIFIRSSDPLRIELPADLTKNTNSNDHPNRKHKDKLVIKDPHNKDLIWRFGLIRIHDSSGNELGEFTTENGDEYLISFWFEYFS